MAVSIDWGTRVITVPQGDLTPAGGGIYILDVDAFRLELKDLEDDEAGIAFPRTHNHNTEVNLSGVNYARTVEIINGYTITFTPDASWTVRCVGANHNIGDVKTVNSVSLEIGNSAGLVSLSTTDFLQIADLVRDKMTNVRLDNTSYDPTTGDLVSARRRYFANGAAVAASTPGGSGEGEESTVQVTAVPSATPGRPSTYVEEKQ